MTESFSECLTNPEGHFDILSSPNFELFVIGAHLVEVISINGKQSTCHHWSPERLRSSALTLYRLPHREPSSGLKVEIKRIQ